MFSTCCRNLFRDRRGAISIVAAITIMVLLAIAAIVIDVGSLYLARRNLQATNDAAALAAVQNPTNANAVVASVFARNGYDTPSLTVTTGIYSADESLSADSRFTTAASTQANAVRVRATVQQPSHFAAFFGLSPATALTTQATAARVPTISFGAGTTLAQINGGLLNTLLGQLWGSNVSLALVDYQALATTNVSALTFFNQLATDIGVTGSYAELARANVTIGQLLTAMAEATATDGAANGNPTGALTALQSLQLQLAGGQSMQLSNLIDLAPLNGRTIGGIAPGDGQGLQINLMSLLSASARNSANGQTINMGTAISVPVTNSSISTRLAVGSQMAQLSNAQIGSSIQTAQVRVAITATLANINLGVATATVQVPIYMEAAGGRATLTGTPCTVGGTLAEIDGTSGVTTVTFGTVSNSALNNFAIAVTPVASPIANLSLLGIPIQINASGTNTIAGSGPQPLSFSQANIDAGSVKSVPDGTAAPFAALGSNMALSASILGDPGLLASLLNGQISTLMSALNPAVDNLLTQLDAPTQSLLATMGLGLGVLDVQVFDASCRTPTLVG